ncbi:protein RhiA [bacterium SCSIO 12741]|nr:protein RhiA [bacterium SCSIO 12741]
MNFSTSASLAEATGTSYSVNCVNNSTTDWVFYVYQTMPQQPSDIFSLAWFASPYKISVGSSIRFNWTIDYSFVWGNTGTVTPGVTFDAGGTVPCDLAGENMTTFSLDNNAPQLSTPVEGGQAGSLTINEAGNVPNDVFSTGIGMSGYGTFVQQAYANTTQVYTPEPEYWVAAATEMQMGVVLAQTVNQAASFKFEPNVYSIKATLGSDNLWTIENE